MKKVVDLRNDRIFKLVLHFALPMMLAQFINVLYCIIDRIFIGNIPVIGDVALAGVGVCAPITTLITSFSSLIGLGAAPLFSIALGQNNQEKAKKILANSFLMLIVTSIIIMILALLIKKPMLINFGASETSFVYADQYLTIYCFGVVFSIISLGLNQFITAQGFSKVAMSSVIAGALTNIVLDALFINVFNMAVVGAALATIIAQFISFLITILFLISKKALIKISFGNYDFKNMLLILKMGLSPFIITATDSVIFIILNNSLKRYGGMYVDNWMSVSTIAQSFFQLVSMPLLGISSGTQPLISYNYGAEDYDRVKKSCKIIVLCAFAFTTIAFIISFFISGPFSNIFTSNEWIIENSKRSITYFMLGSIFMAFQYCFVDGLTALAQPQYSIFLSLFRKIGMMILFVVLPIFLDISFVFLGESIMDICGGIMSTIIFLVILPKILRKKNPSTSN